MYYICHIYKYLYIFDELIILKIVNVNLYLNLVCYPIPILILKLFMTEIIFGDYVDQ